MSARFLYTHRSLVRALYYRCNIVRPVKGAVEGVVWVGWVGPADGGRWGTDRSELGGDGRNVIDLWTPRNHIRPPTFNNTNSSVYIMYRYTTHARGSRLMEYVSCLFSICLSEGGSIMRMFTLPVIHYSVFVVYLTFSEHLKHQLNSMLCFTTKITQFFEQYVLSQTMAKSNKNITKGVQIIIHK